MTALLILIAFLTEPVLTITSTEFNDGDIIPLKYTCDGKNISPPLSISDIPKEAQSLVLIVEDPDAPHGTFDHWVVWNIPVTGNNIKENEIPGIEGKNGGGKMGYVGPCPPSGRHHYHFKVYALDKMLSVKGEFDKQSVQEAMKGHILATGELIGIYGKK